MVYLDANILIYLLEGHPVYGNQVASHLTRFAAEGQSFVTSVLSLTEVLTKRPDATPQLLHNINRLTLVGVDEVIALNAARLQSEHSLKIADALHLATCIEQGCTTLFTNDKKLSSVAEQYCASLGLSSS